MTRSYPPRVSPRRPHRATAWWSVVALAVGLAAGLLAGCGGASQASDAPPAATTRALHLVGLGDSIAGAGHCGECQSYVWRLGPLASDRLGRQVLVDNLARNDDFTAGRLSGLVTSDAPTRAALAAADIITIGIGWNDWQGPCHWEGHEGCLQRGQKTVERNLGVILDEIATLRAGAPTAIRVVTYADRYAGKPDLAETWDAKDVDPARIEAMFRDALASFNAMSCEVAAAHDAVCVDVLPAFNGAHGDRPIPSDLDGTQAQMDLIASTIDAAGYAPLD